jgi:hypothetical protein
MGTRVWPLAVIILAMVLPLGWTGVLVLLVLELELIRPLASGRPALARRRVRRASSCRLSADMIAVTPYTILQQV